MKSGAYTESELAEVRTAAHDIAKDSGSIRDMARTLSERLGRSETGLALILGREVQRISRTAPRRRGRPRRSDANDIVALVRKVAKLAREVEDLGQQRARLDRDLRTKATELAKLRGQLMKDLQPAVEDEVLAPRAQAAAQD